MKLLLLFFLFAGLSSFSTAQLRYEFDLSSLSPCSNAGMIESNLNINFYPNPAKNKLFVSNNESCKVQFYTLNGSLIFTEQLEQGQHELDLQHLSNGVYFLICTTQRGVFPTKICLER